MADPESGNDTQSSAVQQPGLHELQHYARDLSWLVRQYLADAWELVRLEGRLASRSLVLIGALTLCLAGLLLGTWLVLVAALAYGAAAVGVPAWGIFLGLLLLHLLGCAAVALELRKLARYLTFRGSRAALRWGEEPHIPTGENTAGESATGGAQQ